MRFEITIPCHNEAHRLDAGFAKLAAWLEAHPDFARDASIAIADNGSSDGTLEIAQRLAKTAPVPCRVRHLDAAGLALALRDAWDSSEADIVGYCDTDMATDLDHLLDVAKAFAAPAVLAVNGSRWLPRSVVSARPPLRRLLSWGLRVGVRLLSGIRATDIACGFKFFRRAWFAEVSPTLFSQQFFLGGELLFLAQRRTGGVVEIPLRWTDRPGSRVGLSRAILSYWHGIRHLHKHR
ncbi:MAG: glycosyltransferase [Puniceicoccales bacterium]|jgi:glycosyltransferase involved in cell wall biosynthesis|nr:glycosyltransferase [Puniceicoccales bacterium]